MPTEGNEVPYTSSPTLRVPMTVAIIIGSPTLCGLYWIFQKITGPNIDPRIVELIL